MSSNSNLQLVVPVAANTTYVSSISDLLHMNSMAFSAYYNHASLLIADLKMYFSDDGIDFILYRTQQLDNTITKDGNLVIPKRYFKFEIQNQEPTPFSATKIFFYAHETVTQNIDVNLDATDIQISGMATEATQLLVKNAVVSTEAKIIACNTGSVVVSSSVLPTGASTELKQDGIITKLGEVDLVLDTINTKISNGNDVTLIQAQQVLLYGRTNTNQLNAIKTDGNGKLDVNTEIDVNPVNSTLTNKSAMSNVALNGYVDNGGNPYFRNLQLTSSDNKLMVNDSDVYDVLVQTNTKLDSIKLDTAHRATTSSTITGFGSVIGNVSSTIDLGNVAKDKFDTIMVNGINTASTFEFVLEFSENGTDWGTDGLKPQMSLVGTDFSFSLTRSKIACRYVRLYTIVIGVGIVLNYTLAKFN